MFEKNVISLRKMKQSNMNWEQLLQWQFGMEQYEDTRSHERTEYRRDYDRLIFPHLSAVYRTKHESSTSGERICTTDLLIAWKLPAWVARWVKMARQLRERYPASGAHLEEIGAIVSAACLAHDLGNPLSGHIG